MYDRSNTKNCHLTIQFSDKLEIVEMNELVSWKEQYILFSSEYQCSPTLDSL